MQVYISHKSHNGGTNNLTIAQVVDGYSVVKGFSGKTAVKRAESYLRKISKVN